MCVCVCVCVYIIERALQVCVECLEASAEQSRVESNSIVQGTDVLLHLPLLTLHPSHPHSSPSTHHTLTPHPPPITPLLHLPVLSRLQSVCSVVLHFDPSLMVLVWRGMGRLLCQVKQELPESWSIQPIITELCIAMETKCAACVQCAPTAQNEVTPLSPLLLLSPSPSPPHPHTGLCSAGSQCSVLKVATSVSLPGHSSCETHPGRQREGRGGGESRNEVIQISLFLQEFQQSSFQFAEVLFNLLLNTHR